MVFQPLDAARDGGAQEAIVGIEKQHIGTLTDLQSTVACRGNPSVLLSNQTDCWVALCDCGRLISRAVIDDDHFEGAVGLIIQTLERTAQVISLVKARNDDGN
jgi:hypothetical protein